MDFLPDESPLLDALDRHEQDLRAYARALLPNWEAVDEVMQEACLVMWRKFDQLESVEGFLPWAKIILRFEVLKARRRYARDRHVFSDKLIHLLAYEGRHEERQEAERLDALEQCLQKLSPQNRELVLAPYRADHAVTRIAERTGRTVNSLYKLLGRLRGTLRDCVEDRISGLPDANGEARS